MGNNIMLSSDVPGLMTFRIRSHTAVSVRPVENIHAVLYNKLKLINCNIFKSCVRYYKN